MAVAWHARGERGSAAVSLRRVDKGENRRGYKEVQVSRWDGSLIETHTLYGRSALIVRSGKHITEYIYNEDRERKLMTSHYHEPVIARPIEFGIQKIYRFDNGFGASVVKSEYSYGGQENLWELAVITFDGDDSEKFELTYETPITNDVIGSLTDDEVEEKLAEISQLSWRHTDEHVRNSNNHSGNLGGNPASEAFKRQHESDENN